MPASCKDDVKSLLKVGQWKPNSHFPHGPKRRDFVPSRWRIWDLPPTHSGDLVALRSVAHQKKEIVEFLRSFLAYEVDVQGLPSAHLPRFSSDFGGPGVTMNLSH